MAVEAKKPSFPKVLYGTIEPTEHFVVTSETVEGIEGDNGDAVGVYELTAVKRLKVHAPELAS